MTTATTDTTRSKTISTLYRACTEYLRQISDLEAEVARQKQQIHALECTMSRMDERPAW